MNHLKKSNKDSEPVLKTNSVESEGYGLLSKLRLHSEEGTGIKDMAAEDIYKHHKVFHQNDPKDFKKWDKNMIKLTDKHRINIKDDVVVFERHHRKIQKKTVTSRGKLFWGHHAANSLLVEDTKNDKAAT